MTNDDRKLLRKFSDAQILEELAKREEQRSHRKPIQNWCDDCNHFKPFCAPQCEDVPDDYNPCSKGHKMTLRTPESYTDDWGLYRRVCKDRDESTVGDRQ